MVWKIQVQNQTYKQEKVKQERENALSKKKMMTKYLIISKHKSEPIELKKKLYN